jgi:hypothetical protein
VVDDPCTTLRLPPIAAIRNLLSYSAAAVIKLADDSQAALPCNLDALVVCAPPRAHRFAAIASVSTRMAQSIAGPPLGAGLEVHRVVQTEMQNMSVRRGRPGEAGGIRHIRQPLARARARACTANFGNFGHHDTVDSHIADT